MCDETLPNHKKPLFFCDVSPVKILKGRSSTSPGSVWATIFESGVGYYKSGGIYGVHHSVFWWLNQGKE